MAHLLLIPGLIALLAEPLRWLVRTWTDPAYDSDGALVALLVAALLARSAASGPAAPGSRRGALALLGATASLRLLGRLLDVDQLGALALPVDVIALGMLLGLDRRPWAVAPWALGGLALMSLPVEHVLQQVLSWPLRVASAATVAALLSPLGIVRQGTLLADASGTILQVDVACSGATGLCVLGSLAFAVATRRELSPVAAVRGIAAVLGGAWLANTVRLLLLVLGPTEAWLAQPAHTVVGLVALGIGCLPALRLARALPERQPSAAVPTAARSASGRWATLGAAAFSLAAVWIARAPAHPIDVSGPVDDVVLPRTLYVWTSEEQPLSETEERYRARFGGAIQRRTYHTSAPHTVLLVRTTAPIRHLHSPASCLRGSGHAVERLGRQPGAPGEPATVLWRSVGPDGRVWRVQTTFVSADGQAADSASEVAWRALSRPGVAWSLIERISPWEACEADPAGCAAFDHHLLHALEASVDPEV